MGVRVSRRAPAGTRRARPRQVNIRVDPALYRLLESVARTERRSVPQAALHLMESGLRQRLGDQLSSAETAAEEIAALAAAGAAFDWLAAEPDLYDESCGEPL